jgi:hypothetical protein
VADFFVSEEVAGLLDRLHQFGVSQRTVQLERDLWILMQSIAPAAYLENEQWDDAGRGQGTACTAASAPVRPRRARHGPCIWSDVCTDFACMRER